MTDTQTKCCANCAYLTKRNLCERYNIYLFGMNMRLCSVCECFMPVSDESGDVIEGQASKNHSRE